jgi:transcriptional regulator with XRE-family HTH domain
MKKLNRVKIARAINNQDTREFAKEVGYSASMISRIENGERNVPEKISDYCEVIIKMFVANELVEQIK